MLIEAHLDTAYTHAREREPGEYPSEVRRCSYGMCLVATMDLPAGTVVEKFEGPIVLNADVPESAVRHTIIWDDTSVIIPETPAKFANHSCDPNSYVNDLMEIVTSRPVKRGEEITFSYNWIYEGRPDAAWDDRWTFQCKCGSPRCQGLINKYVPAPPDRLYSP
ncbi:MAG: SET domain-containing protein-lysine N-methyltransferase [Candidatus Sigynarchaeota archaeon]